MPDNDQGRATGVVIVDLVRDEILTTQQAIAIEVPAQADPDFVARAVGVPGVDGQVRSARGRGRFVWAPDAEIKPGRYSFVVEALADKKSQRLSEAVEVPFSVVASPAKIPDKLRIESYVRIRLSSKGIEPLDARSLPGGNYIDFVKATDRRSGEPVALEFDQDGRAVDGEAKLEEHQKSLAAKMGKVHPALDAAVRSAKQGEKLLVDVWFEIDEGEPNAGDRPLQDCDVGAAGGRAEELRQRMRKQTQELAAALRSQVEIVRMDDAAPLVTVRVPASGVRELAGRDDVAGLFLHEVEGIEDLNDSIQIAGSDVVHTAGQTGSGVRVAVWESGPTSNANLVIAGRFDTSPSTSNHSQNVHAIIRNSQAGTPNGHAPGCSLYSANDTDRAALTWAVNDQDCTVVNQSFHRSSEPGSGALSSDDLYGDWLALHWPYPLIVHAAGNFWNGDPDGISPPSSEFVNHKGFNTISVGNHNDDADAMATGSVFRNPTSGHGDRELPEISANGTGVTADGITMTGTSQASPAVTGVAALIQGTAATLKHWPEGCRAILLGSATRNVMGNTWWQDVSGGVDARDGAGAVNAAEARQVAQNRRWRNAPATRRGWDVGLLASSDFGSNKLSAFDYKVSVPSTFLGPRNVKVALAWTSKLSKFLGILYTSNLAVDLDLKIFDENGNQVGYSGSWDNSYEIAEFVGSPGKTYTIRIRRWSGTDSTWYGIAWTVTGGLLVSFPFGELVLARASRT
ncbi:MAG TPA: S8 family serine peptidase [Rhodothermales bacterium]|nr:S8 family serine peptidase [Rhodothermales bacterium]